MNVIKQRFIGIMFDGVDSYKVEYEGYYRECIEEFLDACRQSGAEWGYIIVASNGHRVRSYRKMSANEKMVKDAVAEAIDNNWAWRHIVCKLIDDNEELDEEIAFKWACEMENRPTDPWTLHCGNCYECG
jgi:hypothetical protein